MSAQLESLLDSERRRLCLMNDEPASIRAAVERTNATLRALRRLIVTSVLIVGAFYAGAGFEHAHRHPIPTVKVDPSAIKMTDNVRSPAHDNLLEQQNVRNI